jgi:transcriptional regulator with XRE-family HTH domain
MHSLSECAGVSRVREDSPVTEDVWKSQLAALGALVRAERTAGGLSLRELSERTNVSNAYLSQLERGMHEPSLRVMVAIAAALDVPLDSMLVQTGMIEGEVGDEARQAPTTEDAINVDPRLSSAQRLALTTVYRSFLIARF